MTAAAENTSDSGTVKYITAASMIDCTGAAAQKNPVIVLKGKRMLSTELADTILHILRIDLLDLVTPDEKRESLSRD